MESRKKYYQRMKRRARNAGKWYVANWDAISKNEKAIPDWQEHYRKLARNYGLTREFKKMGIF